MRSEALDVLERKAAMVFAIEDLLITEELQGSEDALSKARFYVGYRMELAMAKLLAGLEFYGSNGGVLVDLLRDERQRADSALQSSMEGENSPLKALLQFDGNQMIAAEKRNLGEKLIEVASLIPDRVDPATREAS